MTRLTGAVGKNGKFVIGKIEKFERHSGYKEESNALEAYTHAAELVQPFKPDGAPNEAYSTLYHHAAIQQGIIDKDPEPDFQKFE